MTKQELVNPGQGEGEEEGSIRRYTRGEISTNLACLISEVRFVPQPGTQGRDLITWF